MGRKAISEIRRQELMQATLECIAESGIDGLTLSKVARRAHSHAPIVAHYFGNKEALVEQTLDFIADRVRTLYKNLVEGVQESERLFALAPILDKTEPTLEDKACMYLIAAAHSQPRVAEILAPVQQELLAVTASELRAAFPRASSDNIRIVSYGLVALGQGHNTIVGDTQRETRVHDVLECVRRLVATLATDA